MLIEAVFWGVLGLILGSFANVLILRHGVGSIRGRSACPQCGTQLQWFELIPLISWLALRGRCRTCAASISFQYPLVELMMGALTLLIGLAPVPILLRIIGIVITLLLLAITVYDLRHMLIPDVWAYSLAALAFVYGLIAMPPTDVTSALIFLASGPLVALPLATLWFFSHGKWMGLGDAKLVLSFGWLLGLFPAYVALMLAFVIGAIVGIAVLLPYERVARMVKIGGITRLSTEGGGFTMKSEVPFGPFLIVALCLVWITSLYGIDVPTLLLEALVLSR